jgi:phosphoglycolate phosphatase
VFAVEAEQIRRHHAGLLATAAPHPEGACAFLDSAGSCRIYDRRPYVCRTQGLPLRWIEEPPGEASVEYRDICPLNEAGPAIETLPEESCWTIGPVEGRLATLQARRGGGLLRRIPLRSLFAGRRDGRGAGALRHVLLDLDGTLTDSGEGITRCIAHALTRLGREAPPIAQLTRYVGPPLAGTFRSLLETEDEALVHRALTLYRERFTTIGILENRVYPDIPAGLAALQAMGHRLWIATTKPEPFARRVVEQFGLTSHFAGVYGSDLNGERAEKGDLIRHLLRAEGIAPDEAVMVGDREHDILGARQNGLRAIGIAWGYGSREELVAAGPDAIAGTVEELVAAIRDLG